MRRVLSIYNPFFAVFYPFILTNDPYYHNYTEINFAKCKNLRLLFKRGRI